VYFKFFRRITGKNAREVPKPRLFSGFLKPVQYLETRRMLWNFLPGKGGLTRAYFVYVEEKRQSMVEKSQFRQRIESL